MQLPDFSYEITAWRNGNKVVAGLDEVGRGSLAGPVVAGCVVYQDVVLDEKVLINDSKKLSSNQRKLADLWIRENAYGFGIGLASVTEINKLGIKKATDVAFRRAIVNSKLAIDHLLIDAFFIPYTRSLSRKKQTPIIKGDGLSISIASASIIAKVYRDTMMIEKSQRPKYSQYEWDKNKGYGTKKHIDSIRKYGVCNYHRKQFVKSALSKA